MANEPSKLSSHPRRFAVFDWLNGHSLDTWLVHDPDGTEHAIWFNASPATDKLTPILRTLAFSALRQSDQRAIALLSQALVAVSQLRLYGSSVDEEYRTLSRALESQFRTMFFLTDDKDWSTALATGAKELEKGENEILNDWCRSKEKTAFVFPFLLNRTLAARNIRLTQPIDISGYSAMDLRLFVLDELDHDPDLVWACKSTEPLLLALDDPRHRLALRDTAYKAPGTVVNSAQVDLLAYVLIDSSLGGADLWSSEIEREDQALSPRRMLEKQFRLLFSLKKDKDWEASRERGQVEIEKAGNEVLKDLYEGVQDELECVSFSVSTLATR